MHQSDILIAGFTRQETLRLTGYTASRLAYVMKIGLVTPRKIKVRGRSCSVFSWEQLLELRVIQQLRKSTSLQTIRQVMAALQTCGFDRKLHQKQLIVVNNEVFWLQDPGAQPSNQAVILQLTSQKRGPVGQFVLSVIPQLYTMIQDIWQVAEQSAVIDFASFQQRFRPEPT
jgi:DNA-binding transcriptional MerR regulator